MARWIFETVCCVSRSSPSRRDEPSNPPSPDVFPSAGQIVKLQNFLPRILSKLGQFWSQFSPTFEQWLGGGGCIPPSPASKLHPRGIMSVHVRVSMDVRRVFVRHLLARPLHHRCEKSRPGAILQLAIEHEADLRSGCSLSCGSVTSYVHTHNIYARSSITRTKHNRASVPN